MEKKQRKITHFFHGIGISLGNLEPLAYTKGAFGPVAIFRHPELGKIFVLNGEVQHVEAWAPLYHEPLVHLPAAFVSMVRDVVILGGGTLYAAAEVLKYRSVKRIVLLDHDPAVSQMASELPVFIMGFSHTFAEAGLFSSTVEIASLISLPIIGIWADKNPAKRLVLWSLILYPLVGFGYLFAGMFSLAAFIVIARAINGFTWELENVGIATYYRRVIERTKIATSFGYLDTWTNLAWIFAAVIGMFLVSFLPIHYLLFAIAPFSIIAYFIALRVPKDPMVLDSEVCPPTVILNAKSMNAWRAWIGRFWLLGLIVFFSSVINSLISFFIPITAYLAGANLPMVVLLGIFGALPALFGYMLGIVADRSDRYRLIALCLFCVAIVAIWLAAVHSYWLKLSAVFLLGIILELLSVVQSSLITTLGPANTYGKRGSAFESISTFGDLAAPLVLGVALDVLGFSKVTLVIGAVAVVLATIFLCRREEA